MTDPFDPFVIWLAGEVSLQHLRELGVREETIRAVRAGQDQSMIDLRARYVRLWRRTGEYPHQLLHWPSPDHITR